MRFAVHAPNLRFKLGLCKYNIYEISVKFYQPMKHETFYVTSTISSKVKFESFMISSFRSIFFRSFINYIVLFYLDEWIFKRVLFCVGILFFEEIQDY